MATKDFTPGGNLVNQDQNEDNGLEQEQAPNENRPGNDFDYGGETPEEEQEDSEQPDYQNQERPSQDGVRVDILSLGSEPPEYSPSWRWDLRKIKIFKTDNTLSPIDPFTLFYRTRSQNISQDVGNFGQDFDKRVLINTDPLLPQQEFSNSAKIAVIPRPLTGGPRHSRSQWVTYFNWSYNGYRNQEFVNYQSLQPQPTDPNLPKIWSDSFLGYDSPKEQSPTRQDVGDSSLYYSSNLPDPFKNPNGLNMPQRIRSLCVSSSLQRMDSVQESSMLSAVSAQKNQAGLFDDTEEPTLLRNQLSVAGYVPPEGQDSLEAFIEENSDTFGDSPAIITAQAIQQVLDSSPSYSKERANAAAFSVYTPDGQEISRHRSYQKYEFFDFNSRVPFVKDVFVHEAARTYGPNQEGLLPNNMAYAEAIPNYSFYNRLYEKALEPDTVLEADLPNYYVCNILSELNDSPLANSPQWEALVPRDPASEKMSNSRAQILESQYEGFLKKYIDNMPPPNVNSRDNMKSFFSSYARGIADTENDGTENSVQSTSRAQTILLASRELPYFSGLTSAQKNFPMSVEIKIPLRPMGSIGSALFGYHLPGERRSEWRAYTTVALNAYMEMESDLSEFEVPYVLPCGIETYGYNNGVLTDNPQTRPTALGLQELTDNTVTPEHASVPDKTPREKNNSLFDAFTIQEKGPGQLSELNFAKPLKVFDLGEWVSRLDRSIGNFSLISRQGGEVVTGDQISPAELESLKHHIRVRAGDHYDTANEEWTPILRNPTSVSNFCTFTHILSGRDTCTSETLFFKIEKIKVGETEPENEVVQTIYIPNAPHVRLLPSDFPFRYIDTQLKFGET